MFLDKYHVVRRLLIGVFTYEYLNIAHHIFFINTSSEALKISVFVSLTGIFTFIVKFYCNSRDKEIKK